MATDIRECLITNNFTPGRMLNAVKQIPQYIILHTEADSRGDSVDAILSWWNNPKAQASAHYMVQLDGKVVLAVKEDDTAWQAGNWTVNTQSIGIEHEDDGKPDDPVRTELLYKRSAELVAEICQRYYIPCRMVGVDKNHMPLGFGIFRHKDVCLKPTACPGGLDCERIVKLALGVLYGTS